MKDKELNKETRCYFVTSRKREEGKYITNPHQSSQTNQKRKRKSSNVTFLLVFPFLPYSRNKEKERKEERKLEQTHKQGPKSEVAPYPPMLAVLSSKSEPTNPTQR